MRTAGRVVAAVVASVALARCAHVFGDFAERLPRGESAPHGPASIVPTASSFAEGDEFDLSVRSLTETSRELSPTMSRYLPCMPDGLEFAQYTLRGHVRVDQAQRGLVTTMTFTVTDGALATRGEQTALSPGRSVVLTVLGDPAHPTVVASAGRLSAVESAVFNAAFSQSPLFVSLSRWFGAAAPRREGEQWQVGVEDHGDREWLGDPTTAPIVAQLAARRTTEAAQRTQLRGWIDGPLVARQIGDNGTWQRRRATREFAAELVSGRPVELASMSVQERIEFATPNSVTVLFVNSPTVPIPRTEYSFDTITVRRTIALRHFRRTRP